MSRMSSAWDDPRFRSLLAGALSVAALCTAFTALYWNRFLAPSAGSIFFYVSEQILKGRVPYRDFSFLVPPLEALKTAGLVWLFGDRLIVPRFEGMVERVVVGLLLYFWLARFCRPGPAMLAAFFTIVQFATDTADPVESYHHASVFWAVAAGVCAGYSLQAPSRRGEGISTVAAGFFCGLSLLTKQTTGAGVLLAIAGMLVLLKWRSLGNALRIAGLLAAGLLPPVAAVLVWLWHTGALSPFVRTMFVATTSKGNPLAVLSRPVLQFPWLFFPVAVVTPLLARLVVRVPTKDRGESLRMVIGLAAASALALLCVVGSVRATESYVALGLTVFAEWSMLMLSITGSAFLFVHYGWRFFQRGLEEREAQAWMMSGVSFAVSYMLSLSWAVYGPMAAPSLALITGLALDRLERAAARPFWALAGLLLLLTYASGVHKLTLPFSWMSWPEPSVVQAKSAPSLPQLAGLRISEPTLSLTEKIAAIVKENTRPGESLVVYPYFPLFYSLTGLNPPTYAYNYYIDVCPDEICRQAAATILSHPPDAIVYMVEDDLKLSEDEAVFRSGAKSGSREVVRAIEKLRPAYQKLLSAPVPNSTRTIEVYVRRSSERGPVSAGGNPDAAVVARRGS